MHHSQMSDYRESVRSRLFSKGKYIPHDPDSTVVLTSFRATCLRLSIPDETAAGQFLSRRHQKETPSKRKGFLFAEGHVLTMEWNQFEEICLDWLYGARLIFT